MHVTIAQAIPPLWILPFGLLYAFGIPCCALLSVLENLAMTSLARGPFLLLTSATILVPVVGLVSMEMIEANNRAFYNRTLLDDAKANWGFWAMTFFAVLMGAFALYRRSRITNGLSSKSSAA
jgi:hypothetical protein